MLRAGVSKLGQSQVSTLGLLSSFSADKNVGLWLRAARSSLRSGRSCQPPSLPPTLPCRSWQGQGWPLVPSVGCGWDRVGLRPAGWAAHLAWAGAPGRGRPSGCGQDTPAPCSPLRPPVAGAQLGVTSSPQARPGLGAGICSKGPLGCLSPPGPLSLASPDPLTPVTWAKDPKRPEGVWVW